MKKIVINGKFLCQRITGVQRYAREIVNELDKIIEPNTIELLIPDVDVDLPNLKNIKIIKYGIFKNNLWEQISLPRYVKKNKALCYNLCNVSPLKCPDIVTVFDMKFKAYPYFFNKIFRIWYSINIKNAIKKTKLIFTDSFFAKKEIIKYYPFANKKKIVVTYCGWEHYQTIKYDDNALNKYSLEKRNYYFAMGSMDPNKNFKYVAELAKKNPNEIFAVAGSINKRVFENEYDFDIPKNMFFLGYVSDSEAKTLMRDSKAFLFPSIYEGFGIPPLEAISADCRKVIVSNIEVMHEIYGDNVCYFDENYMVDFPDLNFDYNEIISKYTWKASALIIYKELVALKSNK